MRRKSDKFQARLLVLFMVLSCAVSFLASCVGYRSLSAMNAFEQTMVEIQSAAKSYRRY